LSNQVAHLVTHQVTHRLPPLGEHGFRPRSQVAHLVAHLPSTPSERIWPHRFHPRSLDRNFNPRSVKNPRKNESSPRKRAPILALP